MYYYEITITYRNGTMDKFKTKHINYLQTRWFKNIEKARVKEIYFNSISLSHLPSFTINFLS